MSTALAMARNLIDKCADGCVSEAAQETLAPFPQPFA
jgi:hypothetical protein